MMRFAAVVVVALLATPVWATPSPEPTTPNLDDSTTTNDMTAPAPLTSSSARATTSFYKPQGTCCKRKNWDTGECESIQATDNALWLSHTPEGSDTWCGVDECACGRTSSCVGDAQNCGYNNPATDTIDEQCICAAECFSKGGCCTDFTTVCSATTPDSVPPSPSPGGPTTSSPPAGTTNTDGAVSTLRTTTMPPPSTTTVDANATNTLDPADNTVVIVASVSVVVVIVIVVLVIFTVRHIKKKRAEDKPLFAASTTNYVGPQDGPSSLGSPGGESVGSTGGPAAVEPSGRAHVYQSSRGTGSTPSRRSKSSKKSKKKSKKSTRSSAAEEDPAAAGGRQRTPAAADGQGGGGGDGGAAASSRGSSGRRSRRSPSKGKSKSPASTTPHAHDDVFASPTHHNFEL